jgi:hypothetical protein
LYLGGKNDRIESFRHGLRDSFVYILGGDVVYKVKDRNNMAAGCVVLNGSADDVVAFVKELLTDDPSYWVAQLTEGQPGNRKNTVVIPYGYDPMELLRRRLDGTEPFDIVMKSKESGKDPVNFIVWREVAECSSFGVVKE